MDGINMVVVEKGLNGREWALGDEAGFTMIHQAKRVIDAFNKLFETWEPREINSNLLMLMKQKKKLYRINYYINEKYTSYKFSF